MKCDKNYFGVGRDVRRRSYGWPIDEADEVPDGAAMFPEIPAELGVHPLLLAVLHAYVFLDGSDAAVVNPEASSEAMEYLATYLQRLSRTGTATDARGFGDTRSATRRNRSGRSSTSRF